MAVVAKGSLQVPSQVLRDTIATRRGSRAGRARVALEHGTNRGPVHRLKLIKRQMYGRAKLDLSRIRVLNVS